MEYKDLGGKVIRRGADACDNGADMTGGRKYGKEWATYQAVGGYKAQPDNVPRPPADKILAKRHVTGVDNFGQKVAVRGSVDVKAGSWNRGSLPGVTNERNGKY